MMIIKKTVYLGKYITIKVTINPISYDQYYYKITDSEYSGWVRDLGTDAYLKLVARTVMIVLGETYLDIKHDKSNQT